ncbi:MAG TPA: hypothetical protein VFT69_08535 [Pseudolabrys sp.]|nr:hypothetical protein [Pseudolabrys sp.]
MYKSIVAATFAAAFLAAPLSPLVHSAAAQSAGTMQATKKAKRQPTPGQLAARERQKKCGAEWKAAKQAGKIQKGMTWPKYWSACNKRLKGGG